MCGDHNFIDESLTSICGERISNMAMEKVEICDALALSAEVDGIMALFFICDNPNIESGIIVHESYHLLNMCFKYIFYDHQENDELEAYMLESIFEDIHGFLNKIKNNEED